MKNVNEYAKRGFPEEGVPFVSVDRNGVPTYRWGGESYYGESPNINDDHIVQKGNNATPYKLVLKKSWEISHNYLGVCTTRMPREKRCAEDILQVNNLIDGDLTTCWSSNASIVGEGIEPIFVRIDLAREYFIDKVVLCKRTINFDRNCRKGMQGPRPGAEEIGRAMPKSVRLMTSCDAYNWDTDYTVDIDTKKECVELNVGKRVKQIKVSTDNLSPCEFWCYSFSIGSVLAIDNKGNNVALASCGAGAVCNSTMRITTTEEWWHWGLPLDIGFKWVRIGYHDDPINWHFVEQEKGVLLMDREAKHAVELLADNGVEPIYCINFGNRLYEGYGERRFTQLSEWNSEAPPPPKSEEALMAWDNFVRYSVETFSGKVKYYEIWNEWNGESYWGDVPNVEHYIILAKRTIKLIRNTDPNAIIIMGSSNHFVHDKMPNSGDKEVDDFYMAIDALAPHVDVIGYHPFYQPDLFCSKYINYNDNIIKFKKYCESKGFVGDRYMASEFAVGAMYPKCAQNTIGCWWGDNGRVNYSEVEKAKVLMQLCTIHTAHGIESCICEMSSPSYPLELSLLRRTTDSYPITAMNPTVSYYTMRNMCTILDKVVPASYDVECSNSENITICTMIRGEDKVIALWQNNIISDDYKGTIHSINVEKITHKVTAYNAINGEVFELNYSMDGRLTIICDVIVRDYPIYIFLE